MTIIASNSLPLNCALLIVLLAVCYRIGEMGTLAPLTPCPTGTGTTCENEINTARCEKLFKDGNMRRNITPKANVTATGGATVMGTVAACDHPAARKEALQCAKTCEICCHYKKPADCDNKLQGQGCAKLPEDWTKIPNDLLTQVQCDKDKDKCTHRNPVLRIHFQRVCAKTCAGVTQSTATQGGGTSAICKDAAMNCARLKTMGLCNNKAYETKLKEMCKMTCGFC